MQAELIVSMLPTTAMQAASAKLCIGVGSERHIKYLPITASVVKPTYSLCVAEDMREVRDRGSFNLPVGQPTQQVQQKLILANTGPVAMHFCFDQQHVSFSPQWAIVQPQQQMPISVQSPAVALGSREIHMCSMHVGKDEMLFNVHQTCAQPELHLDVEQLLFKLNLSSDAHVQQATTAGMLKPLVSSVLVQNSGTMTAFCAFAQTSFLSTQPWQFQVEPDQQCRVSIQLSLMQLEAMPSDLQLVMTYNSIAVSQWQLPCRLHTIGPALHCQPAGALDFGELKPAAAKAHRPFRIFNAGKKPLQFCMLLNAQADPELGTLQLSQVVTVDNKLTLAPLQSGQLHEFTLDSQADGQFQLSMRPGKAEGRFDAAIKVSAKNQWVFAANGHVQLFQHDIQVSITKLFSTTDCFCAASTNCQLQVKQCHCLYVHNQHLMHTI